MSAPGPDGPDGPDALLAQLAALRGELDAPVDDRRLVDHRAGRLSAAEAAEVDALLLRSPAARGIWLALGDPPSRQAEAAALAALKAASAPAPAPFWQAWRRWLPVLALAGAAAVALVWFARPAPSLDLPPYEGVLQGAVAEARGVEAPEGRRFVPTSQVTLLLRPTAPLAGEPVRPQVFVGPAAGPLRPAPAEALVATADGGWRFRAPARALFQATGPQLLVVAFSATPLDPVGASVGQLVARWSEGGQVLQIPVDYARDEGAR